MRTREELALEALKRDFKRLSKIADKAKAVCDEYMNVGSEMIAIHEDFVAIVKSKDYSPETLKKLEALKKRSAKAEKIRSKDLIKLIDKQSEADINRDSLGGEIQMMEFRLNSRNRRSS